MPEKKWINYEVKLWDIIFSMKYCYKYVWNNLHTSKNLIYKLKKNVGNWKFMNKFKKIRKILRKSIDEINEKRKIEKLLRNWKILHINFLSKNKFTNYIVFIIIKKIHKLNTWINTCNSCEWISVDPIGSSAS